MKKANNQRTDEVGCTLLTERYQWMPHTGGGQIYGNQEEIRQLTKPDFERYMVDRVAPNKFHSYIKRYPNTYISLVRQNNAGSWRLNRVGSLEELRPSQEAIKRSWAKEVDDFSSADAVRQGKLSALKEA